MSINHQIVKPEPQDVNFTANPISNDSDWYIWDMSGYIIHPVGKASRRRAFLAADELNKLFSKTVSSINKCA